MTSPLTAFGESFLKARNSNKNMPKGEDFTILHEVEEYTENISKRLRKLFWNGVCFCFDLVLNDGRSAI